MFLFIFFAFFFTTVFIYLFLTVLSLHGCSLVVVHGLLLACCSLVVEHGLSGMEASVVVACGLRSCNSWAPEHRLNSCGQWAWLLLGMWALPELNSCLLHSQVDSLPLSHQRSPGHSFNIPFASLCYSSIRTVIILVLL